MDWSFPPLRGLLLVIALASFWPFYAGIVEGGQRLQSYRGRRQQRYCGSLGLLAAACLLLLPLLQPLEPWQWLQVHLLAAVLATAVGLGGLLAASSGELGYGIGLSVLAVATHALFVRVRGLGGGVSVLLPAQWWILLLGALFTVRGIRARSSRWARLESGRDIWRFVAIALWLIAALEILFDVAGRLGISPWH